MKNTPTENEYISTQCHAGFIELKKELEQRNKKEEESPSYQYKAFQWDIFSILHLVLPQFLLAFSREPSEIHLHAINNFKVSFHRCYCFLVKFIFTNIKRNVAANVLFYLADGGGFSRIILVEIMRW